MSNRLLNGLRGLLIVGLVLLMAATSSGVLANLGRSATSGAKLASTASEHVASMLTVQTAIADNGSDNGGDDNSDNSVDASDDNSDNSDADNADNSDSDNASDNDSDNGGDNGDEDNGSNDNSDNGSNDNSDNSAETAPVDPFEGAENVAPTTP